MRNTIKLKVHVQLDPGTLLAMRGLRGRQMTAALRTAQKKAAKPMLSMARRLVPRDTGSLARSLTIRHKDTVSVKRPGSVVFIGPDSRVVANDGERELWPVRYAHLVEYGHRNVYNAANRSRIARTNGGLFAGMWGRLDPAKSDKRVVDTTDTTAGNDVQWGKSVSRGRAFVGPRPFLRPAFEANVANAEAVIAREIKAYIDKVFERKTRPVAK